MEKPNDQVEVDEPSPGIPLRETAAPLDVAAAPEQQQPLSTREKLELHKIQLEINDLREWWRRPQFIASFLPAVVALVGLFAAMYVGYFDKARLDLEKSHLLQQVEAIEGTKAALQSEIQNLRERERGLLGTLSQLSEQRNSDASLSARTIDANQAFAKQNNSLIAETEGLREEIERLTGEVEKFRSQIARDSTGAEAAKRTIALLREELSMLPPVASSGALLPSSADLRVVGGIFGANFEEAPGKIRIKVVRTKPFMGDSKPPSERAKETLLTLEVAPPFITEWSWRRLNFYLSPDNRTKLEVLQKRLLPSGRGPSILELGSAVEIHGLVETAVGKTSEWINLTTYPPQAPEIR